MIEDYENKIIQHDTSKIFPLPDECVDVCITSPPYWGLRDYSIDGQIGLEKHPQEYIDKLVLICREIKRVLKKSGSFYLNLGDTYCSTAPGTKNTSPSRENRPYGQHGLNYRPDVKYDGKWLQPKQLMLIPSRVAIALQEDGWVLRNDIIWRKPNPMPSSVKDRLNTTYEHMFHFVKSRKYYYDLDGIRIPHKEGVTRWGGNIMKPSKNTKYITEDKKTNYCKINKERIWRNQKGKNPGDVLNITTKPFKGAHFAVFPLDLISEPLTATLPRWVCKKCGKPRERIIKTNNPSKKHADKDGLVDANKIQKTSNPQSIKSLHRNTSPDGKTKGVYYSGITIGWTDCGCNAGFDAGIILDPFAGRGTVGKWCKENWGRYILFDIKPEYCRMAHLYIGGQKRKIISGQTELNE